MKNLILLILLLSYNALYSQDRLKREISVTLVCHNDDSLQVIPYGSSEFISKIKTSYV